MESVNKKDETVEEKKTIEEIKKDLIEPKTRAAGGIWL